MSTEGFHPNKSRVGEDSLADFIRSQISGDLLEVPGVGKATVPLLNENGINTTFQLIAKFLSFKDNDVGDIELANRFYFWLKSINSPAGFRAGIVHSLGEKLNLTFPGIYDSTAYDDA